MASYELKGDHDAVRDRTHTGPNNCGTVFVKCALIVEGCPESKGAVRAMEIAGSRLQARGLRLDGSAYGNWLKGEDWSTFRIRFHCANITGSDEAHVEAAMRVGMKTLAEMLLAAWDELGYGVTAGSGSLYSLNIVRLAK